MCLCSDLVWKICEGEALYQKKRSDLFEERLFFFLFDADFLVKSCVFAGLFRFVCRAVPVLFVCLLNCYF